MSGPLEVLLVREDGVLHCDIFDEILDQVPVSIIQMAYVRNWGCRLYCRNGGEALIAGLWDVMPIDGEWEFSYVW